MVANIKEGKRSLWTISYIFISSSAVETTLGGAAVSVRAYVKEETNKCFWSAYMGPYEREIVWMG